MNAPPAIPDHALLRVIGRGSYGEVWLARNVMGMLRAVKVVHRERFEDDRPYDREFGGIRRYEPISRGEGLVPVLHVGRNDATGCFYYVMELADSVGQPGGVGSEEAKAGGSPETYQARTLRSDLDRVGRLPVDEGIEIAHSLATGLAQLHRHGLVHRDLKPSNVIFVGGRAKLADPGLVTGADESRSFVGTEGFVPPEGPGTAAADLFALGRLLYQAATGLPPERFPEIPADWLDSADIDALMEFHEIVLRLGEGAPARRYSQATDVLADLALLQSGKSVRQLRSLERRVMSLRRVGWVALAAVSLAGLLGGWFWHEAQRERDNAERLAAAERRTRRELINARLEQARAERLAGGLGRRDAGLRALTNAAQLRPDRDQRHALRSEAAATVAQLGFRWVAADPGFASSDPMSIICDRDQLGFARRTEEGQIAIEGLAPKPNTTPLSALQPIADEVVEFSHDRKFLTLRRGSERIVGDLAAGAYVRTNSLVAFDPAGGAWLAGPDGSLVLDRLADSPPRRTLSPPVKFGGTSHWHVAAASDQGLVAAAAADEIVWWNSEAAEPAGTLSVGSDVFALAWSAQGQHLAAGTAEGEVLVWHLPDPSVQWRGRVRPAAIRRLAFSGDGSLLAVAAEDEVLTLLTATSGRVAADMPAIAWNLGFRSTDQRLGLVWRGGRPGFVESQPAIGLLTHQSSRPAASDSALAFSPEGEWLAAGTAASIDVWNLTTGTGPTSLPAAGVRGIAWARKPSELLWVDGEGFARHPWPVNDSFQPNASRDRTHPWSQLAVAPNGVIALADPVSERVILRHGREPERALGPHPFVRFLALRPDGDQVASGSLAQTGLQLWDSTTSRRLTRLLSGANVRPVFSPDGSWLAAAGSTCTLWRGPDWATQTSLPAGPTNTVAGSVAFSHDCRLLAAVYGDHRVQLFRLPDLSPGLTLEAPGHSRILALAFHPRRTELAVTTITGEVLRWQLDDLERQLATLGLSE